MIWKDFGIGGFEDNGDDSVLLSDCFSCFERTHSRNDGAGMGVGALKDITGVVDNKATFDGFAFKCRSTADGGIAHLIRRVDLSSNIDALEGPARCDFEGFAVE